MQRIGIRGAVGLVIVGVGTHALKRVIKRPRPYDRYPNDLTPAGRESSFSMPSGHTSTAFYTATWVSLSYPKWYVIAPSFLWAGLVGHSRNHLGVHYPTDVWIGALLGAATAWGVHQIRI
jgi:membrane-associated phospholipid phosphatase